MFVDTCIPKDNEEEFISIAEKLGTKKLLFLYLEKDYLKKTGKIQEIQRKTKIKLYTGINTNKNTQKQNPVIFGTGERNLVENKNIKYHYGFELLEEGKDSFHHRKSGANQVIMKIMKDKQKKLVIGIETILESPDQPKTLGRIQQNLALAKKYEVPIIITSLATKPEKMRGEEELRALIRILGSQEQAKQSTKTLSKTLE